MFWRKKEKRKPKWLQCKCGSREYIEVHEYFYGSGEYNFIYMYWKINGKKEKIYSLISMYCKKCGEKLKQT